MPIETVCQKCAAKLRVEDRYAGAKARCPKCKTIYTVPGKPSKEDDYDRWRLKTSDGEIYGPASRTELDAWVAEGRITPTCSVQREGDLEWAPATSLYPALAKPEPASANPFRDEVFTRDEGPPPPADNPFVPTRHAATTRRRHYQRSHRGGTIITFGIMGIVCCGLLAPAAWIMGMSDLKEMESGDMDPGGRGMTQAGMVLGIIGTVILALQFGMGVISSISG